MKIAKCMNTKDSFLIKFSALTVGQLKSLVEEFSLKDQICLDSDFTEEYTVKLVNEKASQNFNPITGFYEDYNVTLVNELNKYNDCAKTISSLIESLNDMPNDLEVVRDVDEGYTFAPYENVLITHSLLIFF